jgi:hypothetical protein
MYSHERHEAGVLLVGLRVAGDGDALRGRETMGETLADVRTQPCADLLFGELRRVKSSNTTRGYLATVIKALKSMPLELIEDGFTELAADKSFSQKMRAKFRDILIEARTPIRDFW